MRTGLALVMIAGAMATAAVGLNALHKIQDSPGIDLQTTASIARPSGEVFRLSSVDEGGSCQVIKGKTQRSGRSSLTVDPACDKVLPGMSRVRFWRERPDGSIDLTGEAGESLATFAVGDGFAYESFRPRTPLLRLSSE
ncbi:MAG: hypothetical protein AB7P20_02310 [Rhizobiaceae bacterium]